MTLLPRRRVLVLGMVLLGLSVAYGVAAAHRASWTCDDAFISFRYGENLVAGRGLVFNEGERVEGYTNFLWTLWIAAGMAAGLDPERWSAAWGIVFYAGTILLLGLRWRRGAGDGESPPFPGWPLAALLAASNVDWNDWATGGLETSLFTFLVLLGYLLLTGTRGGASGDAAAGAALGLAATTRPEGALFGAIGGLYVLSTRRPAPSRLAAFLLPLAAILGPFAVWKLVYYGDFLPNTYYAKSAYLTWYAQGLTYARLYFQKHWVLLLGIPFAIWGFATAARQRDRRLAPREDPWLREAVLAAAFAVLYTASVIRVGGDFMHARMLIPATPFFLVLLEVGLARVPARPWPAGCGTAAAIVVASLLTPHPVPDRETEVAGIVNERMQYPPERCEKTRQRGLELRRHFEGLPVRMAFLGSEARLVYYARPSVAIESETGLTDRFVARQELRARGRVGHEKKAPLDYLVGTRKAHFVFHSNAPDLLNLTSLIPHEEIDLGGVVGYVLHWDPDLMRDLARRGALFADFPARLDAAVAALPETPDKEVAILYGMVKRFYFDFVHDPARERPFLDRIGGESAR